jgi:phage gpG-like protein
MRWGVTLTGLSQTIKALESLRFQFADGVTYVAGPTVEYAVFHELGTSKMKARPFARPAAERVQANPSLAGQFVEANSLLEVNEEELVKATALAVEQEMVRTITRKGIIDTGTLRESVKTERVN